MGMVSDPNTLVSSRGYLAYDRETVSLLPRVCESEWERHVVVQGTPRVGEKKPESEGRKRYGFKKGH